MINFFLIIAMSLQAYAIPHSVDIPADAYGVWEVPYRHIETVCYFGSYGKESQHIIDAEDSALYAYEPCGCYGIADHYGSSGTWCMEKLDVDDVAFMVTADGITKYQCYLVAHVDYNGRYSVNGKEIRPTSSTDIICSTCVHDNSDENYIAIFKEVGDYPCFGR